MSLPDHILGRVIIVGVAAFALLICYPFWVHFDTFHEGSDRSKRIVRMVMASALILAAIVFSLSI